MGIHCKTYPILGDWPLTWLVGHWFGQVAAALRQKLVSGRSGLIAMNLFSCQRNEFMKPWTTCGSLHGASLIGPSCSSDAMPHCSTLTAVCPHSPHRTAIPSVPWCLLCYIWDFPCEWILKIYTLASILVFPVWTSSRLVRLAWQNKAVSYYLHILPYHGNPLFRPYISLLFYLFLISSGLNC
jgi:hypothetical protein